SDQHISILHALSTSTPPTAIYTLSLHDALPICESLAALLAQSGAAVATAASSEEAMAHLALSDDTRPEIIVCDIAMPGEDDDLRDRKSTRLNSSHDQISYAVFCLKKKKKNNKKE